MKIINVMAATINGIAALHPRESDESRRAIGMTNDEDYQHLLELIRSADAVIVGKDTVEASGLIDTKNSEGVYPSWYIYSNHGFAPSHEIFSSPVPFTLVSQDELPKHNYDQGAGRFFYGEYPPARTLVDELRKIGKKTVLLLGGGSINQIFYKEGLVDELFLTVCPLIAGTEQAVPIVRLPLPKPVLMTLESSKVAGNLVFLKYKIQNQSI